LKKISSKKASYFVQSESAKIAGILKKKAMKKKLNIVYEKNVRIGRNCPSISTYVHLKSVLE